MTITNIAVLGVPVDVDALHMSNLSGATVAGSRWASAVLRYGKEHCFTFFGPSWVPPQAMQARGLPVSGIADLEKGLRLGVYDVVHDIRSATRYDKVLAACGRLGPRRVPATAVYYGLSYPQVIDALVPPAMAGADSGDRLVCLSAAAQQVMRSWLMCSRSRWMTYGWAILVGLGVAALAGAGADVVLWGQNEGTAGC